MTNLSHFQYTVGTVQYNELYPWYAPEGRFACFDIGELNM